MQVNEILSHVDHTQLKAYCTWEDIRTREAMEAYLEAGCDRIGSSSAKKILE